MKKDLISILAGGVVILGTSGIYGYNNFCNQNNSLNIQNYISNLSATSAGNSKIKYSQKDIAIRESNFYRRDF